MRLAASSPVVCDTRYFARARFCAGSSGSRLGPHGAHLLQASPHHLHIHTVLPLDGPFFPSHSIPTCCRSGRHTTTATCRQTPTPRYLAMFFLTPHSCPTQDQHTHLCSCPTGHGHPRTPHPALLPQTPWVLFCDLGYSWLLCYTPPCTHYPVEDKLGHSDMASPAGPTLPPAYLPPTPPHLRTSLLDPMVLFAPSLDIPTPCTRWVRLLTYMAFPFTLQCHPTPRPTYLRTALPDRTGGRPPRYRPHPTRPPPATTIPGTRLGPWTVHHPLPGWRDGRAGDLVGIGLVVQVGVTWMQVPGGRTVRCNQLRLLPAVDTTYTCLPSPTGWAWTYRDRRNPHCHCPFHLGLHHTPPPVSPFLRTQQAVVDVQHLPGGTTLRTRCLTYPPKVNGSGDSFWNTTPAPRTWLPHTTAEQFNIRTDVGLDFSWIRAWLLCSIARKGLLAFLPLHMNSPLHRTSFALVPVARQDGVARYGRGRRCRVDVH